MFCENCGKELKENAKFCENCGAKVPQIRPESEVQQAQAAQENVYVQGTQPEAQPQQGWQEQSAAPEEPASQPQQGWQEQTAAQGIPGPQPQQGWQDANAAQGGPGPQPQQNWQSQQTQTGPQGGFGGPMPQGTGDIKEQFMTIVGLGKPMSGMSIGALVLTLLCCGPIGAILAIVDIVQDKDHAQNHLLSVIAIAIAVLGLLAGFGGGAATMLSDSLGGFF